MSKLCCVATCYAGAVDAAIIVSSLDIAQGSLHFHWQSLSKYICLYVVLLAYLIHGTFCGNERKMNICCRSSVKCYSTSICGMSRESQQGCVLCWICCGLRGAHLAVFVVAERCHCSWHSLSDCRLSVVAAKSRGASTQYTAGGNFSNTFAQGALSRGGYLRVTWRVPPSGLSPHRLHACFASNHSVKLSFDNLRMTRSTKAFVVPGLLPSSMSCWLVPGYNFKPWAQALRTHIYL